MNAHYKSFLKKINWLLAGLLTVLGFGAVGCDKMYPAEYGTPHATYALKGKVIDEQNRPIPHIQVQVQPAEDAANPSWYAPVDTVYTDEQGNFAWERNDFIAPPRFQVLSEDPDEDGNGGWFASDTLQIDFSGEKMTGGKGWYEGRAEKEVAITLKKYVDPHTAPYVLYTFYGQVTNEHGVPIPHVLITTDPAYYPETATEEKNDVLRTSVAYYPNAILQEAHYAARTNWNGKYRFSYDRATPAEHVFYASYPLNENNRFEKDSFLINFADIKLYEGQGLIKGKGSQEINFILKEREQ